MSESEIAIILTALKVDLGIMSTTSYDTRLKQIIGASYEAIKTEGASTLNVNDLNDAQLVVMYAAWTWRKRENGEGMPRMLRYALNNRVLKEKAR